MSNDNRYLHLARQDCPLPPGTHVVAYCRDSGGDRPDRRVAQQMKRRGDLKNLLISRNAGRSRRPCANG
jgi:hypothetical protein